MGIIRAQGGLFCLRFVSKLKLFAISLDCLVRSLFCICFFLLSCIQLKNFFFNLSLFIRFSMRSHQIMDCKHSRLLCFDLASIYISQHTLGKLNRVLYLLSIENYVSQEKQAMIQYQYFLSSFGKQSFMVEGI